MAPWMWIILAFTTGLAFAGLAWPRVRRALETAPPPDLPENLAPGWYACCSACGRTRTLASVGGIRLGGNRHARKATLGWCRQCRALRVVRIVHAERLDKVASPAATP